MFRLTHPLRTITAAIVLACLGAASTIVVSWACATRHTKKGIDRAVQILRFHAPHDRKSIQVRWPVNPDATWPATAGRGREVSEAGWSLIWADAWRDYPDDPVHQMVSFGHPPYEMWEMVSVHYGLPFRSATMHWWNHKERSVGMEPMVTRVSWSFSTQWLRAKGVESLPVIPLWPGFALNSLFYAAIAWGVWQVPLAIRRRGRRRLKRCVTCGYDRAGLAAGAACPECGANRC